jgi:hypothetical protein
MTLTIWNIGDAEHVLRQPVDIYLLGDSHARTTQNPAYLGQWHTLVDQARREVVPLLPRVR